MNSYAPYKIQWSTFQCIGVSEILLSTNLLVQKPQLSAKLPWNFTVNSRQNKHAESPHVPGHFHSPSTALPDIVLPVSPRGQRRRNFLTRWTRTRGEARTTKWGRVSSQFNQQAQLARRGGRGVVCYKPRVQSKGSTSSSFASTHDTRERKTERF